MHNRQERGDRIIAFAVMIQSLLIILQTVMIGVFHMNADSTTVYRVALTAIPMIAAMIVSVRRNVVRFLVSFAVALFLLLYTIVFFPKNEQFAVAQGFRFFLPVVVPSFICLSTVYDFSIVERTLYRISWFTAALVFIYIFEFYRGVFSFEGYNMPFSYACLLPMVSIYSHRKVYDIFAVAIMLLAVLAIGARGPAVYFLLFVVIDLFQHKSRWRFLVLLSFGVMAISLSAFYSWLINAGIKSRTISLFIEGNFLHEAGRDTIQYYYWRQLLDHPLLGIGLFGDRVREGIAYCHNLFLEVLLDFGVFIGSILIVGGLISLVSLYAKSESEQRNIIIRYFCALVLPLMTSQSYLIDSSLAIFIGICVLLYKNNTTQHVIVAR